MKVFKQHAALVDVIQWLDANGHSNEPIRETVDRVLKAAPGTGWRKTRTGRLELVQVKREQV